ncbi:MAG: hypothetical protein J4G12_07535 [Gemmatimonadetes bacterium]|nr:hypothetical protein [Gemmatimonadota bacterium]
MRADSRGFKVLAETPETATCLVCADDYPEMELDRMFWCTGCMRRARERAGWWGWLGGIGIGAALALYIALGIRPSADLLGAWFGVVAMGTWLGSKACREIAFGVIRYRTAAEDAALPESKPSS